VTTGTSGNLTTVAISGGTSQATDYACNTRQELAAVTDASTGEQWIKNYNLLGQVTSSTTPNSGSTAMTYDGDGNVTSTTDADGHTISYTYDALDRKTGEYDGPTSASRQLASWVYDNSNNVAGVTDPVGHLTTETSYSGGNAYTLQEKGFNVFGESLGETLTLPSAEGALAGSYALTHLYSSTTGLLLRDTYPASPGGGALPAETVTHGYETGFDLPDGLGSTLAAYGQQVIYTAFSQVAEEVIGTTTNNASVINSYDENTGALKSTQVENSAVSSTPFDTTGDRTTQTEHSVTGGTDTVTSYSYGNTSQPDTLTGTSTSGSSGTSTASYSYDLDGNTLTRDLASGNQKLTWTDDGNLATDTTSAGTTSYVYDPDGNVLLEKDPGQTTLFLFGGAEQLVLSTSTGAITGTRFLALPGGGEVVRTGAGTAYDFELTDQHGTSLLTLDHTAANPVWRQFTPYGAPRGTAPASWPDSNAFLGKPTDASTGLDLIGDRQYDPDTGRFLSVDPVLDTTDTQTLGGYTYAADNPVTQADPTGLLLPGGAQCGVIPSEPCQSGGTGGHGNGGSGNGSGSPGTPSPGAPYPVGPTPSGPGSAGCDTYIQVCGPTHATEFHSPVGTVSAGSGSSYPCVRTLATITGCASASMIDRATTASRAYILGLQKLGAVGSQAGKNLGNSALSSAELSLAGQRMSFLSRNSGLRSVESAARSGELGDLGGGLTALGAGLTIYDYTTQGDSIWEAVTKRLIVTGASYAGGVLGAAAGGVGGALMVGPDVTGIPEAAGAATLGLAGAYGFGTFARDTLNLVWP
jgi:RHS repeat-associated protein